MKESSKDRRPPRTKKAIKEALTELMEEKGFNELTITDLTNRADINRGTFYQHYEDKFDLLEKCETELISQLGLKLSEVVEVDFNSSKISEKQMGVAIHIFKYFKENARFMKALLGPKGDPYFQIKLKSFFEDTMFNPNSSVVAMVDESLVLKKYFTTYIISAHIGILKEWLQGGMKESPEEMAQTLLRLSFLGPFKGSGFKIK